MAIPVLEDYQINTYPGTPRTVIGVFKNATDALLSINFSWLNIKIYKVDRKGFKRRIKAISGNEDNWYSFEMLIQQETVYGVIEPRLYAMVPIKLDESVTYDTMQRIQNVLLLMFPSNFHLYSYTEYGILSKPAVHLVEIDSPWTIASHHSHYLGKGLDQDLALNFEPGLKRAVNKFVKVACEHELQYLNTPLKAYESAFGQRDLEMSFLNYIMALEALITDGGEITFKLARMCAVVNGDSINECEAIFNFAKDAYGKRSRLVHSGKADEIRETYLDLQALVSTTLMEIITFNIKDKDEFKRRLISTGYGNKKAFNPKYKQVSLSISVSNRLQSLINKEKAKVLAKTATPTQKKRGKESDKITKKTPQQ